MLCEVVINEQNIESMDSVPTSEETPQEYKQNGTDTSGSAAEVFGNVSENGEVSTNNSTDSGVSVSDASYSALSNISNSSELTNSSDTSSSASSSDSSDSSDSSNSSDSSDSSDSSNSAFTSVSGLSDDNIVLLSSTSSSQEYTIFDKPLSSFTVVEGELLFIVLILLTFLTIYFMGVYKRWLH